MWRDREMERDEEGKERWDGMRKGEEWIGEEREREKGRDGKETREDRNIERWKGMRKGKKEGKG